LLNKLEELDPGSFRFPVDVPRLLEIPEFERLLLVSQVRKTTWLRATLLWIKPVAALVSPALPPPKKLVLFLARLVCKARERLPPAFWKKDPPELPILRWRLNRDEPSWDDSFTEEKELLEAEETLLLRTRPF
jgi:hypothetical protein